ncbi:hypothetical protein BVRB_4g078430 [Beta vulgaris subsp. vulgaris]|nr:hypothetical protein BVRB_4g078430 [Beta vulgaris subsp. vulgaris]
MAFSCCQALQGLSFDDPECACALMSSNHPLADDENFKFIRGVPERTKRSCIRPDLDCMH